jgi:CBS domain-containing protein
MTMIEQLASTEMSELMHHSPITVGVHEPLKSVVESMRDRFGAMPVVEGHKLVGIFTERDLLMKDCSRKSVKEVMTPDPECILMDDTIGTALHKMVTGNYRTVPLVDEAGEPAGVVTQAEAVRYLVGFFPSEALNQPPNSVKEQPPGQYGG